MKRKKVSQKDTFSFYMFISIVHPKRNEPKKKDGNDNSAFLAKCSQKG
jgi:hypothetical protein